MIKIQNKKKFIGFIVLAVLVVVTVSFEIYKNVKLYGQTPPIERMDIKEASKSGEKKTVQLLIQIVDVKNVDGALERGDVVLTAPEDKQFSIAEQEGFLIIKMRLTEDEQQLLALALAEKPGIFASENDRQNRKEIKRRKFAIDLNKIGIAPEEKMGKVISDKVFEEDVLIQKK